MKDIFLWRQKALWYTLLLASGILFELRLSLYLRFRESHLEKFNRVVYPSATGTRGSVRAWLHLLTTQKHV